MRFPGQAEFLKGKREVRFRCTLDCAWEVVATRTTTGAQALRIRGYGRWGRPIVASLKNRNLGRAPVRLTLTVSHPVNPGDARQPHEPAAAAGLSRPYGAETL